MTLTCQFHCCFYIAYGMHILQSFFCCFVLYMTIYVYCTLWKPYYAVFPLHITAIAVAVFEVLFLHWTLLTHYEMLLLLFWYSMWLTPCDILFLLFYITYGLHIAVTFFYFFRISIVCYLSESSFRWFYIAAAPTIRNHFPALFNFNDASAFQNPFFLLFLQCIWLTL